MKHTFKHTFHLDWFKITIDNRLAIRYLNPSLPDLYPMLDWPKAYHPSITIPCEYYLQYFWQYRLCLSWVVSIIWIPTLNTKQLCLLIIIPLSFFAKKHPKLFSFVFQLFKNFKWEAKQFLGQCGSYLTTSNPHKFLFWGYQKAGQFATLVHVK